jgi:hypothetical protein
VSTDDYLPTSEISVREEEFDESEMTLKNAARFRGGLISKSRRVSAGAEEVSESSTESEVPGVRN